MPKYLVHQMLPEGGKVVEDHLEPGAAALADQLLDPESATVQWLWGCADLERKEWHMLMSAPDEHELAEYLRDHPGIQSIRRVFYVTEDNLAWALLRGMAENRKRRTEPASAGNDSESDARGEP
ncbi:hypothetical protein EV191_103182 [Tamaricihabitans halophyticus]|uniref:Muconolactone delta-isomerase n=1 Tax=Tamaricihabitans halophyticus TaxID=1262583 RepID=A0A4R2R3N5_9PSEU|nr:hypothetical protein [Tamaricihabitans halophyticus]TCP54141.1 hypothetical protein EV191_103182 [Tamaricihabitans halophyticus]